MSCVHTFFIRIFSFFELKSKIEIVLDFMYVHLVSILAFQHLDSNFSNPRFNFLRNLCGNFI